MSRSHGFRVTCEIHTGVGWKCLVLKSYIAYFWQFLAYFTTNSPIENKESSISNATNSLSMYR